jgi:hypothetical protein
VAETTRRTATGRGARVRGATRVEPLEPPPRARRSAPRVPAARPSAGRTPARIAACIAPPGSDGALSRLGAEKAPGALGMPERGDRLVRPNARWHENLAGVTRDPTCAATCEKRACDSDASVARSALEGDAPAKRGRPRRHPFALTGWINTRVDPFLPQKFETAHAVRVPTCPLSVSFRAAAKPNTTLAAKNTKKNSPRRLPLGAPTHRRAR